MIFSIKPSEWALFYKLFGTLLAAGHSPVESLSLLVQEAFSGKLKKRLRPRLAELPPAASLAECLKLKAFALDAATLAVFEQAVTVQEQTSLLYALSARYSQAYWVRGLRADSLAWLLTYFAVGVVVIICITTFILPPFSELYDSMRGALPAVTLLLLEFRYGIVLLLLLLMIVLWSLRFRPAPLRGGIDRLRLVWPWGLLNEKIALARFTHMLAVLLSKNMPARFALPLAAAATENVVIERRLQSALAKALPVSGELLRVAGILKSCALFPAPFTAALELAEKTQKLEETLPELTEVSADLLSRHMQTLNTGAQIVSIVVGALLAFWVVSSVYFPLFRLGSLI